MTKTRIFLVIAIVAVIVVSGSFGEYYISTQSQLKQNLTSISMLNAMLSAHDPMKIDSYTYLNGVLISSHPANKTNLGLEFLGNRTILSSGADNATYIKAVAWGNSTESFGAATQHQPGIFNNSAGQGNGFGVKTITIANVTWWGASNPGEFNITAKATALENLPRIAKTYLLFGTTITSAAVDFLAADVCYQVGTYFALNSGGSLTTVWVIQFS